VVDKGLCLTYNGKVNLEHGNDSWRIVHGDVVVSACVGSQLSPTVGK
jgi:hypothetical protein